jgi:RHS repeat-associated protein
VTTYDYNDTGALKSVASPAKTVQFGYDLFDRLANATVTAASQTTTVAYSYDAGGNRVGTTVTHPDGTIAKRRFLYDTQTGAVAYRFQENDATGNPTRKWLKGLGMEGFTDATGPTLYSLKDTMFSTRGLFSDTASATIATDFDAFGNIQNSLPPTDTDLSYRDEFRDPVTGLVHLRARDYDTATGRFTSADPWDGDPLQPATLHRYAYASNDPLQNIDPTGMFSLGEMLQTLSTSSLLYSMAIVINKTCMDIMLEQTTASDTYKDFLIGLNKTKTNSTLLVHGIQPNFPATGWSKDFTQTLVNTYGVKNQDFHEFRWTGFYFIFYGAEVAGAAAMATGQRLLGGLLGLFGVYAQVNIIDRIATESLERCMTQLDMEGYAKTNIICHSWGTFLTHRTLWNNGLPIDTLYTMGSPLGAGAADAGRRPNVKNWRNIYSKSDLVCVLCPGWANTAKVRGNKGDSGGGPLYGVKDQQKVTEQIDVTGMKYILDLKDPLTWGKSVIEHVQYWLNPTVQDKVSKTLKSQP